MTIKTLILLALVVILISLGSALFHLVIRKKDGNRSAEQMARALTVRVALSVALIGFIIVAAALGWITPHGLLPVPAEG